MIWSRRITRSACPVLSAKSSQKTTRGSKQLNSSKSRGSPSPTTEFDTRIRHTEARVKCGSQIPSHRHKHQRFNPQRLVAKAKNATSESRKPFYSFHVPRLVSRTEHRNTRPKGSSTKKTPTCRTPQSAESGDARLAYMSRGSASREMVVWVQYVRGLGYLHGRRGSRRTFPRRYSVYLGLVVVPVEWVGKVHARWLHGCLGRYSVELGGETRVTLDLGLLSGK